MQILTNQSSGLWDGTGPGPSIKSVCWISPVRKWRSGPRRTPQKDCVRRWSGWSNAKPRVKFPWRLRRRMGCLWKRCWKPLAREDALTRQLQILTRDEQGFISQANQLCNRLQHTLGQYYPQALELFSDW